MPSGPTGFGREALERATALKAVHATKSGWAHILVGQDVADELAGDYIAACLSNQRRIAEQSTATSDDQQGVTAGTESVVSEDEMRERRRAERAKQDREREHAVSHNAELGSAILRHLPRLKVDAEERQGQGRLPRQDRCRGEGAGVPRGWRVAGGDRRALFCLIAAPRYADERAVARSNRSMSSLTVR